MTGYWLMKQREVGVLDGSTFAVSDSSGDMADAPSSGSHGLFFRDMRHLSTWQLRLNGRDLDALSFYCGEYDQAEFFLVVPPESIDEYPTLSVVRRRHVGDGMREEFRVANDGAAPTLVEVSLLFDADFCSIFDVKDRRGSRRHVARQVGADGVTLTYSRDSFRRETCIRASSATFTAETLTYSAEVASHDAVTFTVDVHLGADEVLQALRPPRRPQMELSLDEWISRAPRLETDWDELRHSYHRTLVDLAALRFYPRGVTGSVPAAGLPWFMALFGRDSLITSYQALPFVPELARSTLWALAGRQAQDYDDFRDAEPGKILHELRHDDLTHFREQPQSPYYGSADSTLLFLIVLDEYERWTGDAETVRALEPSARAAVAWMERHGDLDGDGYIEYQTRNPQTGLVNQCWKDSPNSIVHPDGTLAQLPRATCELQGYAYDARRRAARLARRCWGDQQLAARLDKDADRLQARFNQDFWCEQEQIYALALDGTKNQVRTVASNMGQLLWSGIVPDDRVDAVVSALFADGLYSGWGIRTLAAGQAAYNPIEYHNGTVWPHDNALIAQGLRQYGRVEEAARLAGGFFDAMPSFDHRLPEAFAGYPRALSAFPVRYPTACSPQAWATGAVLLFLRAVLGLEPCEDGIVAAPHLAASHDLHLSTRDPLVRAWTIHVSR